ncbi:P-loop containing nucleoside triphosphate hydrolase protein [Globomyces pollinis-pini]|nr:P-loop containing nucleoside triphosphate hydrolase protein [Globomyces pollinis-pini]
MSLSQQSLGSSSSSLGRASISDTHSGSYPNSQSNSQSNLYEKSQSNKSIMQDSDEEDENLVPFKKVGKPNLSSSPKQTRSNLNAYGVPMSSVSTTQKPSSKGDLTDRIRVCVRKRPLSKKEARKGEQDIARIIGRRTIHVLEPKVKVDLTKYVENHEFVFDEAFDANASNEEVYRRTAQPLVQYIFEGGKATCFAYGQTGSGKTYTMLNSSNGLYVLAGHDIFSLLEQKENAHVAAYVSFYEIYQGHLYDLLGNRNRLYAREDGKQQVVIKGITEFQVDKVDRLMQIFEKGNATRSTGATGANADSSRSHAIFQIVLKHKKKKDRLIGKLSFIDLAGSERGADRGETDKQTRMEGSEINKSLLALKECIRALDQDSRHTPFRQSKLTQVLKDSFIGNSRTCMIATITPNMSNSEHSLNTLRYADRVKELKGATTYDDDDDFDNVTGEEDMVDDDYTGDVDHDMDGEDFMIDEEFPPDAFIGEQVGEPESPDVSQKSRQFPPIVQASRPPLLTKRSSGLLQTEVSSSSIATSADSYEPKGMVANASQQSITQEGMMDELIRLHRNHIRECTESGKLESKLLVNLTMKMGKNSSDRNSMDITFDNYVRELDGIMRQKINSLQEIRDKIQQHLNGQ